MKTDTLLIGGLVVGALILATKGEVGKVAGNAAGNAAGGLLSGATIGIVESTLIEPYEWAKNYKGYIPIIDDAAKFFANIKNIGNPEKLFG